jgi:hypothetical protein
MGQDRSPSLYGAIGQILKGEELPAINVAMLCLQNLLESAPSDSSAPVIWTFHRKSGYRPNIRPLYVSVRY